MTFSLTESPLTGTMDQNYLTIRRENPVHAQLRRSVGDSKSPTLANVEIIQFDTLISIRNHD